MDLCCYDLYFHLGSLRRLCSGPGVRVQFLHSSNRVATCLELAQELGFNCSVYSTARDLSQTGQSRTYRTYSFQFCYNYIVGDLLASIHSLASLNTGYEIYWAHEVKLIVIDHKLPFC